MNRNYFLPIIFVVVVAIVFGGIVYATEQSMTKLENSTCSELKYKIDEHGVSTMDKFALKIWYERECWTELNPLETKITDLEPQIYDRELTALEARLAGLIKVDCMELIERIEALDVVLTDYLKGTFVGVGSEIYCYVEKLK